MVQKNKNKTFPTITTLMALLIFFGTGITANSTHAESTIGSDNIRIFLNEVTVKERGYTIDKPDGKMRLAIHPTVLPSEAMVTLKTAEDQTLPSPDGLTRVSQIMEYDILTNPIRIFDKDLVIIVYFDSTNQYTKRLYFWDDNQHAWRPLRSVSNYTDHWTRAYAHLPYSQVAVFEEKTSYEGFASWYRSSKYTHGAASNDYPFGTKLRVINADTGASTTVQVVSTGPFVPGRIIDLTSKAFADLAPISVGTIKVHVERAPSAEVLGAKTAGSSNTTTTTTTSGDVPAIVGSAAYLLDPTENRVLFEKNSTVARPIASITKLMSAIVYIETNQSLVGTITIAPEDAAEGVAIAINPGDSLSVNDLFQAMLTGSANNATKALARSSGLALAQFVQRMNDRAESIGMTNTVFREPTGLDPANKASAADVAKLVKYALGRPSIRFATQRRSYAYSLTRVDGAIEQRTISNPMHIGSGVLLDEPVLGGKTGFINEAGYCLGVVFKPANGREYISVVLGTTQANRNPDVERMIHWAYGR